MPHSHLITVGFVIAVAILTGDADRPVPAVTSPIVGATDWQKVANGMRWNWSDDRADLLYGILQAGPKYDVRVVSDHKDRSSLDLTVLDAGRECFTWRGHLRSVFRLLGDHLYYVDFDSASSGAQIVAVDLSTGRELWRSKLKALGPIPHFAYRSRFSIEANEDVVTVFGNESKGQYVEIKDADSGETVGHRVFDQPTKVIQR